MLVPFFFSSSKRKYKSLTALYLTNTEKSWLRSNPLQQATWSNALTNAKSHARKKFFYLVLECSTYKIKEQSQGFFICFMMKNRFNSPPLTSNFQNTAWQLTSVFNKLIKHPSLFQPIRVRVLSELYCNCLLIKKRKLQQPWTHRCQWKGSLPRLSRLSITRQAQNSSQST